MQRLHLVPSTPQRHFAFAARFDIPAPETQTEPTPSHLPPLHTMFSEVEQGVYRGENPQWFISLRLFEADRTARVVGLVTPFYAETVVRDAFDTWQAMQPGDRAGITLTISRPGGWDDIGGVQEPGMCVALNGGPCDVR